MPAPPRRAIRRHVPAAAADAPPPAVCCSSLRAANSAAHRSTRPRGGAPGPHNQPPLQRGKAAGAPLLPPVPCRSPPNPLLAPSPSSSRIHGCHARLCCRRRRRAAACRRRRGKPAKRRKRNRFRQVARRRRMDRRVRISGGAAPSARQRTAFGAAVGRLSGADARRGSGRPLCFLASLLRAGLRARQRISAPRVRAARAAYLPPQPSTRRRGICVPDGVSTWTASRRAAPAMAPIRPAVDAAGPAAASAAQQLGSSGAGTPRCAPIHASDAVLLRIAPPPPPLSPPASAAAPRTTAATPESAYPRPAAPCARD